MGVPRITIEAELTREGLLSVRDAIDRLLSEQFGETSDPAVIEARSRAADRKIGEVWSRVGDNTKRFLATAAVSWPEDGEFTMEDIAREMNVSPKTVRSWHRNLGRTLRQVDEAIPVPKVLLNRADGQRNLYRLPPEIRWAILQRDMPSEPAAAV